MSAVRRLLVLLALAASWLAPARADTPIALARTFDGRVNFTGTQVTLRTKANNKDACAVSSSTANRSASLTLPLGATVLSAQLYWAGSGALDDTVLFEGKAVAATRRYTSATVGGGFNYFGGAADVTAAVKAKGSGRYTFSGLTISIGDPWCASQAVLGGFSLLVVYADKNEPERVLNLYEGFSFVQNSELTVTANNFRWPSPLVAVKERARIGHITWEGDPTLAQDGERLRFEGTEMTDAQNPEGNQFNSRSNINGDDASYGIDFDAFDTTVTIWSGYEPKVTTTYRTGQDLVLLNAEILVLPTMPVSDLSVAISRSGEFRVGVNAAYAVAVANNGPYTEAGPVTVTTTLPNGLVFVSGAGSGWSCTAAAADVTCTYATALAPGASAPGLTITAAVKTTGDKAVKVTVKGTDDDKPANNVATNTSTALPGDVSNNPTPGDLPGVAKYVFTAGECRPGVKVDTAANAACRYYDSTVAAGAAATLYVTAIDGAGNAFAAPRSVPMKFALRCLNPARSAGVAARVGAATLPACAPATETSLANGSWSAEVAVAFADGAASAPLAFSYADVGKVELLALGGGAVGTPAGFVVKPWKVDFRNISRVADGLPVPAAITPQAAAFARAGEALLVEAGARVFDAAGSTVWAPNFGNEATPPVLKLGNERLYTDAASKAHLPNDPGLDIDGQSWKAGAGTVSVRASWAESGATRFVVGLDSYLEQGGINGAGREVGRFQPAFFTTEITEPFACAPGIVCAPRDNDQIGMVYSGQPFPVQVVARGLQDQKLGNFQGDWFRPVTLSMTGPAGGVAAGAFAPNELPASATGSLVYTLPAVYSADAHRAGGWTAPTTVYLRARANDARLVAGGSQAAPILSDRSPAASDEDGVVVINGRLRVANALGTDVLRTPLGLRAEYWTGAAWLGHAAYADPAGVNAALAQFPACTRAFVGKGTPCDLALVGVGAPAVIRLAQGAGVLWLRAPGKLPDGKSRDGSISVRFPGWTWLPSTPARVTFGRHRSPVIYLREMY